MLKKINKYKFVLQFLICAIVFLGFFRDFVFGEYYGPKDWDWEWFSSYWEFMKQMLREGHFPLFQYYEIPMKTGPPYFFAHGETPVLSPFLLLLFFLPVVAVIKIYLLFVVSVGVIGTIYLGKYFRWSFFGPVLMFTIVFLSGCFLGHFYFGHLNWLMLFYFPLIFYNYLRRKNIFNLLIALILLVLVIFEGGLHLFIWFFLFLIVHSLISSILDKSFKPILIVLAIFSFAVLLSSVKLIPSYFYHKEHIKGAYVLRGYHGLRVLCENLLDEEFAKTLNYHNIFYRQDEDDLWPLMVWETYAYLGYTPFILFFLAILKVAIKRDDLKTYLPIIITGLFFLLISYGEIWRKITSIYPFSIFRMERHPSRFIILFIFSLTLIIHNAVDLLGVILKRMRIKTKHWMIEVVCFIFVIVPLYKNTQVVRNFNIEGNISAEQRHNEFLDIHHKGPLIETSGNIALERIVNNLMLKLSNDSDIMVHFKNFNIKKHIKYLQVSNPKMFKEIMDNYIVLNKGNYCVTFKFRDRNIALGLVITFISLISIIILLMFTKKEHRIKVNL